MPIPTIEEIVDLSQTAHAHLFEGCTYAWEVLPRIPDYVAQQTAQAQQKHTCIGNPYIQQNVVIGEGTIVEHGAVIKGRLASPQGCPPSVSNQPHSQPPGPAIIGSNCRIGPGAYIRENVIVGDNCIVGNSVELKHCLLFNGCQVPHYNYIGESVLGYKAHLGAGAICSNWKLMPTAHVFVYGRAPRVVDTWPHVQHNPMLHRSDGSTRLDTGLLKLGAILGDRAEVGCNAVLNPGSVVGRDAVVYPCQAWRGVLPENTIAKAQTQFTFAERRKDG